MHVVNKSRDIKRDKGGRKRRRANEKFQIKLKL